jgi:hypothetical protein
VVAACGAHFTPLSDEVRESCGAIAASARSVRIVAGVDLELDAAPAPALDPVIHLLDGDPEHIARYFLTLDAINFGSGWFPTLRKRPGRSGYETVAASLTDQFRAAGPWTNAQLRAIDTTTVARALDQDAGHELIALYAQALRDLGRWLAGRSALEAIAGANGSAELLAAQLVAGMPLFRDRPFYKRAQLLPADLELAGVAHFEDLDRLTIFADNVVPHVLRCDGLLEYETELAARIDAEQLLAPGREEREIRACALIACEQLAARYALAPCVLDNLLWNRGRAPAYKARPRHRCRCVYY